MTLAQTISNLLKNIEGQPTKYIKCIDCDGETIIIRVADHWANDNNNFWLNTEARVLSFISKSEGRMDRPRMVDEWIIDENGQDKHYNTVEEILSDFCIVSFKHEYYIEE